jgi:hypothetical protein
MRHDSNLEPRFARSNIYHVKSSLVSKFKLLGRGTFIHLINTLTDMTPKNCLYLIRSNFRPDA